MTQYLSEDDKLKANVLIAAGRDTNEIVEELKKGNESLRKFNDLTIRHVVGGLRAAIMNAKRGEMEKRKERSLEEREKKFFTRVFENNEKIEEVKEKAVEYYLANPEKIKPKDYKDLSIAQAIGTRDLREYKQRRAGHLEGFSDGELEAVKYEAITFLRKKIGKREGLNLPEGEAIAGEYKKVEIEADGEREVKSGVEVGGEAI